MKNNRNARRQEFYFDINEKEIFIIYIFLLFSVTVITIDDVNNEVQNILRNKNRIHLNRLIVMLRYD